METQSIDYRLLFDVTVTRLAAMEISADCSCGPSLTATQLDRFEQECSLSLPSSLRQFYLSIGDGLEFRWTVDRSNVALPSCYLTVPELSQLKQSVDYLRMLNRCLADQDFDFAHDVAFARQQYKRQLSFFPFLQDNSDLLCIECKQGAEEVVFLDHEWSFYDRGISGRFLARSLHDFWCGWSNVGFVAPKNFWWPGSLGEFGIEFSVERFGFSLARDEASQAPE